MQQISNQILSLNTDLCINSFTIKTFTSETEQSQIICFQTVNLPQGMGLLTIHVLQEFWEVEELRDELFDIGWTLHARLPGCCH